LPLFLQSINKSRGICINLKIYMQINKRKLLRISIKSAAIIVLSVILFAVILFLLVYWEAFGPLPSKNELSEIRNEQASLVYSADGVLIGKFFAENRTNIKQDEVPEHLKNALIATEDKRFFSHKGYDTRSYFRVFFRTLLMGDKTGGGGSTLTQQLVKNLFGREEHGFLSMPVNKIREAIIATRMEELYNKDELLLMYLNSVPFGEDVYGIESAAQRYFNKRANQLNIQESAVLIGMLKANTYFNPKLNPKNSIARRNMVLELMKNANYLSDKESDSLKKTALGLDYENLNLNAPAGYFVYQVENKARQIIDSINENTGSKFDIEKDGLKIHTTLNMQVQNFSKLAIKKQLSKMQELLDKELTKRGFKKKWYAQYVKKASVADNQKRSVELFEWDGFTTKEISKLDSLWHYYKMLNASVLITNPKNGAVITWVGGNHYHTLPFDMVLSHRQIASAFKPILYATALENGIHPCQYLDNEEKEYPEYKNWAPKNANLKSTPDSSIAMWYALAKSMNIPSVELYFKTENESLIEKCNKLHFPEIEDPTPSLALGTLDLSLYEIVKAYASFANGGQMNELMMIDKITNADGVVIYQHLTSGPEEIFSKETAEQITAMLQQVIEQGTATKIRSQYGIKAELAGKTGSAQNYGNAWFLAYTPNIVLGTWVGASTPNVHFNNGKGSGASLALPIIAEVMQGIEKDERLNQAYFTSFELHEELYSFLDCNPFRQKGVKGFLNRLFGKKDKKNEQDSSLENQKEKKKPFFKRIFKKN
jgi:penicillin-binding protein 1A